MSKGINLEEFKKQLDTDAQKKCKAQEETIHNLIEQNKRLTDVVGDLQRDIEQMQNRCWALTRGLTCIFCGFKNTCVKRK